MTIHVNSLYTSIIQEDAKTSTEWALHKFTKYKQKQIDYILEGLELAMKGCYFWYKGKFYSQTKGVAMGAKFAPSVANIVLNKWEEENIFNKARPEIGFYRRYIDDIILIWKGTETALKTFINNLNHNKYGLSFTGNWNPTEIDFLDLTIFKSDGKLHTKTFFKKTDRNGYIPRSSCHHPRWTGNIPKSQLIRIRRNCSKPEHFERQSRILIERFLEKGYDKRSLEKTKEEVMRMNRDEMLKDKKRNENKKDENDAAFLTNFNRHYREVEKIINKHWKILKTDKILKTFLPAKPKFIYRRAPSMRTRLVKAVLDPPKQIKVAPNLKGFFKCKSCLTCRTSKRGENKTTTITSHSTGQEFKIRDLITCRSTHVTYLLECPCKKQYIGRTTRPLYKRIREHIKNIRKGYPQHSVSRHFNEYHHRDPSVLSFCGIEKNTSHWRGEDLTR